MPDHRLVAEIDAITASTPRAIRAELRQRRLEYILTLRAQGVTQAAIAERVGVNQQRISEILRKHRLEQAAVDREKAAA
jgi:transcriptional regulator with XRE-family HTH domain